MSRQPTWFVIGDDSMPICADGTQRLVECYLVFRCDPDQDALSNMCARLINWQQKYSPPGVAPPPTTFPRDFASAAFSSYKKGMPVWNKFLEPKWSGLHRALRLDSRLLSDEGACEALFRPLGETLDLLSEFSRQGTLKAIIITDDKASAKKHKETHVPHRKHLSVLRQKLRSLNAIDANSTVQLRFDRDETIDARRRCTVCAYGQDWANTLIGPALGRARTTQRPKDTKEMVSRIFAAQYWAIASCLESIDVFTASNRATSLATISNETARWAAGLYENHVWGASKGLTFEALLSLVLSDIEELTKRAPIPPSELHVVNDDLVKHMNRLERENGRHLKMEGPELLEAQFSPVMIFPDFLAGLFSFLTYERQHFVGISDNNISTSRQLTDDDLRHIAKTLDLDLMRLTPKEAISKRLGIPVSVSALV